MTKDCQDPLELPKPLSTLAIGSVPFDSAQQALDLMSGTLDIPAHPQLVSLSPWEDMLLSASSGFPALAVDSENNLSVTTANREEAMANFYEQFFSKDLSFLALDPKSSAGFEAFLARAGSDPQFGSRFLKSQVIGPITFGQMVRVEGANNLVDDPALLEIASLAMGGRAAWAASRIRALGRQPVVFLDEPGLTGYGSAFSTLTPETVISTLERAVNAARQNGPVLVGCHVCGNTDWSLLTKVGLDIINFDAYEYLSTICLYPGPIGTFLEEGGFLAWGVVPTREFDSSISARQLADLIRSGWSTLAAKGVNLKLLKERTLLTSACGLGRLTEEQAQGILQILPKVASILTTDLG
ncbi:MAG: hypothetical protein LBT47_01910 [Deltaproteobacteria bacterium]|jgi:hypothetical protein|nr:hypothetical protein [Deltaproteobacteria bacterium]